MRTCILSLLAGTVLSGMARELSPAAEKDGEQTIDGKLLDQSAVSNRIENVFDLEDKDIPATLDLRRLQMRLQDASKEELVARSNIAYAAVLMDDHDRGIRTLGQSLIDSRTPADLVAILAPGVTKEAERRMRSQGWIIRRLALDGAVGEVVSDVNSADGSMLQVLAHTAAWALTDYTRVILLEDNMLVMENIDDLFACSGVCAAMQQAEVVSTSLIVLEPDLETCRHMSKAVGTTYSFSNDFQGFINSYLAGFETCALFDLENPSLQDPSTDPSRGPDAPLLDHSCHRLPTRYHGDLSLIMLNGGLGMVRTKNAMPDAWWKQRKARVVRFGFAGLRPWMWFASPFLPFVSTWETAHFRAKPSDPMPNFLWVLFVWLSFVSAALIARVFLVPMPSSSSGRGWSRTVTPYGGRGSSAGMRAWWPRWMTAGKVRRCGSASSYNPRGLLWGLFHLTVGYSSLTFAVVVGVRQVPAASAVWMSWMIFITWTSTVFGLLWSVYIWLMSRQPHLPSARPHTIGNGTLDLASGNALGSGAAGGASDPFSSRPLDGVPGGAMRVGAVEPASPWRESVGSLLLFAAVLGFLPAWKPLSGASTLPSLLGPAALALVAMFVGLTVQMVRLPVLWYDRCKFLWAMEREGLYG